jgi:hypothetical protein
MRNGRAANAQSGNRSRLWSAALAGLILIPAANTIATTLRVATYNVDFSDQGNNNNSPAVVSAIEAMGQHHLNGNAQPVDVIGLEELLDTNNNSITSTSLPVMVNALNSYYGAGTYAYDPTPDPTTGGTTTNGPSGLIYDTKTVKVVSATALGYGSSHGSIPRAPMRYLIQPLGYGSGAQFYMYASHYKSGTTSDNVRNAEATEIRADADALGPNVPILYTGDHNLFEASSTPSYQTLISAGNGQAHDPNSLTQVWGEDAADVSRLSGDSYSVKYAEDLELTSSAVYNQAGTYTTPGLRLANSGGVNSYQIFGNGSSPTVPAGGTPQPYQGSVNYAGNLSISDVPNYTTVLANLTVASDHVPVMADYNLVGLTPLPAVWNTSTGNWSLASNWSTGQSPNDPAFTVQINSSNPSLVTLDQNASIANLVLTANNTLNTSAGTVLMLNGPAMTTLSGKFNSNGSLIAQANVSNAGTAVFNGTQNWSTGTVFTNTAGSATFNSDAGAAGANLTVNVSGGVVAFSTTQHLAALNISAGATVTVGGGGNTHRSFVFTPALSAAGTLDITNNDLDVAGGNLQAITALIKQGYDNGAWNGSGIISTSAKTDTAHLTTIGVMQNAINSSSPVYTTLDGATVQLNDILVKYTYFGDTNLDGQVNSGDYARIDNGYLTGATGWVNGDFNYDSAINGSDYTLIDNAFNTQGAQLTDLLANPSATLTDQIVPPLSVPEPAALMPALLALAALPRWRNKANR